MHDFQTSQCQMDRRVSKGACAWRFIPRQDAKINLTPNDPEPSQTQVRHVPAPAPCGQSKLPSRRRPLRSDRSAGRGLAWRQNPPSRRARLSWLLLWPQRSNAKQCFSRLQQKSTIWFMLRLSLPNPSRYSQESKLQHGEIVK